MSIASELVSWLLRCGIRYDDDTKSSESTDNVLARSTGGRKARSYLE